MTETAKPSHAGMFFVAEVDTFGKIVSVLPEQLPWKEARAKATELTKKFVPVRVEHFEWLTNRRGL